MARRDSKTVQIRVVSAQTPGSARRYGVLTVLSGGRPGMIIPIDAELSIGRTEESTVPLYDESLSRLHARFFKKASSYFVEDLTSTNGTFVDGLKIHAATALEDGTRIQLGVGTLLRFSLQDDAELEVTRRVYEATVRDPLTGCFNRHFLGERLTAELSYAKRHATPLSVLFVDADHFKQINDTFGHSAGDEVLRQLSDLLRQSIRSEDILSRFGGEEFVLVIRGTPKPGVLVVAERIRAGVEALEIAFEGHVLRLTVSIGVSILDASAPTTTVEELLARADAALYGAKRAGRNRVEVE